MYNNDFMQYGLIPVVVIKSLQEAEQKLSALIEGGLPVAEITFRTECAASAIKYAATKFPTMMIGAGTVTNAKQCEEAIESGAKFIVAPGFSGAVAKLCSEQNIAYIPGCVTPTEIMMAVEHGISIVKFFPAGIFGGLKAIKALGAAFPNIKFLPTGGVNNDNLKEYLQCDKVVAVGGSWMLEGDIEANTKVAISIARSVDKQK